MNPDDFISVVNKKKQDNPFWFDDPLDSLADDDMILNAESQMVVKFPESYKIFVRKFGGGYFAFTNIFSVNKDSDWYIVNKNNKARNYLPEEFLAISDDEAGGMYGYIVRGGVCGEEVYYWDHESGSISKKMYEDLFEYIAAVCLTN